MITKAPNALYAVQSLDSWRPRSEAPPPWPQRPPPREASHRALPGASQLYFDPQIQLCGPVFNIQEKITVHFHAQFALCTQLE